MATVTYSYTKNKYPLGLDYNPSFGELVDFQQGKLKSSSSTQLVYTFENTLQLKIIGTGFKFDGNGDATAGKITSLQLVTKDGAAVQSIADLKISAVDFQDALESYDAFGLSEWILAGNDTINGSSGVDDIYGHAGNDTIKAGDGDDYMEGRQGTDTFDGGKGEDVLSFQDSYYKASAGAHGITLDVQAGTATDAYGNKETFKNIEIFRGTQFADVMNGSSRDDTLMGLGGRDKLDGKGGFDFVLYHRDERFGGKGVSVDLTKGTAVDGFGKTDTLISIEGARGTSFGDKFVGNAVYNYFRGDAGNDTLNGKGGNDDLEGGDGKDTFVFDVKPDNSGNHDTIFDFVAADDTIQLDNSVFKVFKTTGALAAKEFFANTSGNAADGNDHIIYDTDDGKLYYDADGNNPGAAVHFATVGAKLALSASDFVII